MHVFVRLGLGCPRSRAATSMLSPRIEKVSTLEQLLIDLRTTDSLAWSSFVFLYDSSISTEARARIMSEIEGVEGSTFSFHNLGDADKVDRGKLNMLFRKIPIKDIGGKFLFAVSKDIVSTILEEVWMELAVDFSYVSSAASYIKSRCDTVASCQ